MLSFGDPSSEVVLLLCAITPTFVSALWGQGGRGGGSFNEIWILEASPGKMLAI
jgi:hypothetical protein